MLWSKIGIDSRRKYYLSELYPVAPEIQEYNTDLEIKQIELKLVPTGEALEHYNTSLSVQEIDFRDVRKDVNTPVEEYNTSLTISNISLELA